MRHKQLNRLKAIDPSKPISRAPQLQAKRHSQASLVQSGAELLKGKPIALENIQDAP